MSGVVAELLETVNNLPQQIPQLLSELKKHDEESKAFAISIITEGKEIIKELKVCVSLYSVLFLSNKLYY